MTTIRDLVSKVHDLLGGMVSRADIENTLRYFRQHGALEGKWEDQDASRLASEIQAHVEEMDRQSREDFAYMVEHQTDPSSVG
jgi:hypothetical protein